MKKFSLFSVYFTTCIDSLSWSIVFPIFAPLFIHLNGTLFPPEVSIASRATALGFFLMAFSLGQFFGAPIIGAYADSRGRKKALLVTVFMTFCGLALTAWSVQTEDLALLFAGRLLTGIFAANMSICLACVADLSEHDGQKTKRYGHLSVIVGLSFVLGAFLGGKFSDSSVNVLFSPQLPLWIATGLTFLNFLFIFFGFQETNLDQKHSDFTLLNSVNNIKIALKTDKIKAIYCLYFLFFFAWTILFQFTPVLMVRSFEFTSSSIGDLALFMGICWAIGSSFLKRFLLHIFSLTRVFETALLVFTALCIWLIFANHVYVVLSIVAGCIMIGGVLWPLCNGLISDAAPKGMQGKLLGMSQSVQSLAMTIAPAVAGIAYQAFPGFPFLVSAVASLLAGILYFSLKGR